MGIGLYHCDAVDGHFFYAVKLCIIYQSAKRPDAVYSGAIPRRYRYFW